MACATGMKCVVEPVIAAVIVAVRSAEGVAPVVTEPFDFERELLRTVEMERNQPAFLEEVAADGELG